MDVLLAISCGARETELARGLLRFDGQSQACDGAMAEGSKAVGTMQPANREYQIDLSARACVRQREEVAAHD